MAANDWRNDFSVESRYRIWNTTLEYLQRYNMLRRGSVAERDLRELASRFEARVFTSATDENDYYQKINEKLCILGREGEEYDAAANSSGVNQQFGDPAFLNYGIQLGGETQQWRYLSAQNSSMAAGHGMQISTGVPQLARSPITGLDQTGVSLYPQAYFQSGQQQAWAVPNQRQIPIPVQHQHHLFQQILLQPSIVHQQQQQLNQQFNPRQQTQQLHPSLEQAQTSVLPSALQMPQLPVLQQHQPYALGHQQCPSISLQQQHSAMLYHSIPDLRQQHLMGQQNNASNIRQLQDRQRMQQQLLQFQQQRRQRQRQLAAQMQKQVLQPQQAPSQLQTRLMPVGSASYAPSHQILETSAPQISQQACPGGAAATPLQLHQSFLQQNMLSNQSRQRQQQCAQQELNPQSSFAFSSDQFPDSASQVSDQSSAPTYEQNVVSSPSHLLLPDGIPKQPTMSALEPDKTSEQRQILQMQTQEEQQQLHQQQKQQSSTPHTHKQLKQKQPKPKASPSMASHQVLEAASAHMISQQLQLSPQTEQQSALSSPLHVPNVGNAMQPPTPPSAQEKMAQQSRQQQSTLLETQLVEQILNQTESLTPAARPEDASESSSFSLYISELKALIQTPIQTLEDKQTATADSHSQNAGLGKPGISPPLMQDDVSATSDQNTATQDENPSMGNMSNMAEGPLDRFLRTINCHVEDEIREINQELKDTVVEIRTDGNDTQMDEAKNGIVVKLSYNAIESSADMKFQHESNAMMRILPLRLLIPHNYPNSSPLLLRENDSDDNACKEHKDLTSKARVKFISSIAKLAQPISIKAVALTWAVATRNMFAEERGRR